MATKRAGIPKPKPELYFEQVPLELAKAVAKPAEKKPKMRLVTSRSKPAGR
jgi:hypothetical protein